MMTSTEMIGAIPFPSDIEGSKSQIQQIIDPALKRFDSIVSSYIAFNMLFCLVLLSEAGYIFFHLSFLLQSFVLAMSVALCIATLFFYSTLKIYYQTKKMERCLVLKEDFIHSCKAALQYRHAVSEHHNSLAAACAQFASSLHGKEYSFYHPPAQLKPLAPLMSKLSCWCHWDDVHSMREMLLVAAIDEHVKLVRCLPTDMTAHTGLANAYVMLSGLYVDPRSMEGFDDERWIPQNKYGESVKAKFRQMSERAIEEFKILNDYAPRDPWVHAQLAYSYRDLQMPKEEIKEYETILQLCPDDKEVLMKLGQLYFQQGHNAQGLQIYERLKRANYKKAESLIHYYG
jgi:tetratricopeptide (TPR) repeat protein